MLASFKMTGTSVHGALCIYLHPSFFLNKKKTNMFRSTCVHILAALKMCAKVCAHVWTWSCTWETFRRSSIKAKEMSTYWGFMIFANLKYLEALHYYIFGNLSCHIWPLGALWCKRGHWTWWWWLLPLFFYFFGQEENRGGSVLCFMAVVSWPDSAHALIINNSFRTLVIYSSQSGIPGSCLTHRWLRRGHLSNIDANLCFQVTQILKIYKSNDFLKIQRETAVRLVETKCRHSGVFVFYLVSFSWALIEHLDLEHLGLNLDVRSERKAIMIQPVELTPECGFPFQSIL